MKWFVVSQSITVVVAGVILPFYIVFLQQAADSYSLFAYLYATFTLAAALTHFAFGRLSRLLSVRSLLVIGSAVPGLALLAVPSLRSLWQIYIVQVVLGSTMSLQKSAEKVAVSQLAPRELLAQQVGNYHGVVAICTAVALFASGWFLDTFSLIFLFYVAGAGLLLAAACSSRVSTTAPVGTAVGNNPV